MTGTVEKVLDEEIRIKIGAFEYQILVAEWLRRQVQLNIGKEMTFHVMEYLEGNQNSNRWTPRIIGFMQESELEFFDLLCTVDRIGYRKALKAIARPIREIADAIQRQDAKWLSTLPGIGKQSAEQVIATLRNKVARYIMLPEVAIQDDTDPSQQTSLTPRLDSRIFEEAYIALISLGLSPIDARNRLDQVMQSKEKCSTVQEVISMIFKKSS